VPIVVHPWLEQPWRAILRRKATLPHALLIRGREGIGKLDFARKLAQSLACDSPAEGGAACDKCESCRWFGAGVHPDYREVVPEILRPAEAEDAEAKERKPSAEIRVEEVRALQDFIGLTAHRAGGKTMVIYPAESLNVNAANALLKNLEEPPPATRFLLVAHRPSSLPATIISRCQQIVLPAPAAASAMQWLREQGVADPALNLAQTGNAPLAALALEDKAIWAQRKMLLQGLVAERIEPLALAEQVRDFPPAKLLGWLQRWTYDLLSVKSARRVRYNPDYAQALARLAERLHAVDIARFHRTLVREQRYANHPLNARLYVEQMLIAYSMMVAGTRPDLRHVH